jgi:Rieske 2Fe-2S family protein
MHANTRPATDVGTKTLPARYYVDPAQFRRELERIHFDMWLYAGRSERIAKPGDYFLVEIGDASVVVVRGDDGAINAFHNVCRHRGTRLCGGAEGTIPGRIRCPYHAWTYSLDGTLAHAPHMEKVAGFALADHPLVRVHVASWAGHVFINLAAQPMPFAEHLGGIDTRFANWKMERMRSVERRSYTLHANWKLVIQNYHECLHCPLAHPQLHRQSHYMSGDNEPAQPTWLGARMDLREGIPTLSTSDAPPRAPLPGLDQLERRSIYYYAILPNMLLNLHPDYVVAMRMSPRAVDRTDIVCEWLFDPDTVAAPGFDAQDAIDFWHTTNQQDWELSDLAQAGISSRGYQPGPYSNREDLLMAFDRWVLERTEGSDPR